jgi:hypothetical protein
MPDQNNSYLLYLAHGNIEILYEACYSILSFYKTNYANYDTIKIIVYTDNPELFYTIFKGKNLTCIPINTSQIADWKGTINFVHRVKTKVIQDFFSRYSGNLLYVDSDTVFIKDISPYWGKLNSGSLLMHCMEGIIRDKRNRIIRKIYKYIDTNILKLPDGETLKIPLSTQLWNAGVIGITDRHKVLLNKIVDMTDAMYPDCPIHIVEQFATSYYFQVTTDITATEDAIYHYWDFKEFRKVLTAFFTHYSGQTWEAILPHIDKISPIEMVKPKHHYNGLKPIPKLLRKLNKERWQMPDYQL